MYNNSNEFSTEMCERGEYMEAIIWLGIMIVLLMIEVATLGLTTLWFAGGSLVAFFAALLHAPVFVQVLLFLLVSIVLLYFTRPIAIRYLNKSRVKTNVETIIGKEAVVTQDINNLHAQGQVVIGGMEWTARTSTNEETIEKNAVVVVKKVDGVKLIVSRKAD